MHERKGSGGGKATGASLRPVYRIRGPERSRMIVVAGSIQVDPGRRDAFLEGSAEAIRLARATGACGDFAVSADPVDPGRVNVFELWDNRESLEAFRGSGPDDDLGAMVLRASVREFETT